MLLTMKPFWNSAENLDVFFDILRCSEQCWYHSDDHETFNGVLWDSEAFRGIFIDSEQFWNVSHESEVFSDLYGVLLGFLKCF